MFTVLFFMFHFSNSSTCCFIFVARWKIGKNEGGVTPSHQCARVYKFFFIPSAHRSLVQRRAPPSTSMAGSSSFMTMTSSVSFMAFTAMMSFSFFVSFSAFPACFCVFLRPPTNLTHPQDLLFWVQ